MSQKISDKIPIISHSLQNFVIKKLNGSKFMKEYAQENGPVDLHKLQAPPLSTKAYTLAHQSLPILCHDVAIQYENALLLVQRDKYPLKDQYCVIGGRVKRGMSILDSLKQKVKEECGLELHHIQELGMARTFWKTDPFGHDKGTDTLNIMYFARGKGKITLDQIHSNPLLVTKEIWTSSFKKKLHPYVKEILEKAFQAMKR